MVFLGKSNLMAYCYYVPCVPSVSMATTMATTNMERVFLKINYRLDQVNKSYLEHFKILETNNKLLDNNIRLKLEYLLTLQEIRQKQELLKSKKALRNEKN